MAYNYVGYHGTCKRKAKKIINSQEWIISINTDCHPQWLGDGIYFFENQKKWALKYATEVKFFIHDSAIIKSKIEAENVLDLEDPDDADFLHYVAEGIIKEAKANGDEVKLLNGVVVNFIYNNMRKFDLARCIFAWGADASNEECWLNIPQLSHIQLCVRHPQCIKTHELIGSDLNAS